VRGERFIVIRSADLSMRTPASSCCPQTPPCSL
jgi:hypothetical protein